MQLKIIAVGKVKEGYLCRGIEEYLKRLGPYARVEIAEVPDEKVPQGISPRGASGIIKKEGARVARRIDPSAFLVVLGEEGRTFSSPGLARFLEQLALGGQSRVNIVIGGTLGLPEDIKQQADLLLSLSPLTFPHPLVRLVLLEQLYRSFKIIARETYHR